ncbi:type III pantothenate kinase [Thioalkalivibrio sp. ALJT]|uniref:type III pantothenate kinase n=1 Tax=Thioalkalivibrio sp. ALJT TaxID=1158146 RepID=UPI000381CED9|nr:type III pantothenate kinase [Thioalkalivibrio sp. ALJT]
MSDVALVDIGSSRVKWQVRAADGQVVGSGANRQTEGCARALGSMAQEGAIRAVWVSRVGPEARERAFRAALAASGVAASVHMVRVAADGPHGLHSAYAADQLGVDRYCALVAARAHASGAVVVVDAGTAVTVDMLQADGGHAGGYLFPGRQLGWETLQGRLSDRIAPRGATQWPEGLDATPGLNSTEALERGWGLGLVAALDGLIAHAGAGARPQPACWLTGGDAYWLAPLMRTESAIFPNLVLDGLWELAHWEAS